MKKELGLVCWTGHIDYVIEKAFCGWEVLVTLQWCYKQQ